MKKNPLENMKHLKPSKEWKDEMTMSAYADGYGTVTDVMTGIHHLRILRDYAEITDDGINRLAMRPFHIYLSDVVESLERVIRTVEASWMQKSETLDELAACTVELHEYLEHWKKARARKKVTNEDMTELLDIMERIEPLIQDVAKRAERAFIQVMKRSKVGEQRIRLTLNQLVRLR